MIKLISYKSIIKYNGQTIDEINNARMAESQQNKADYIALAERQGRPTPIFVPLTKLQQEYQRKKTIANREIAQEAILIELEKTIKGEI